MFEEFKNKHLASIFVIARLAFFKSKKNFNNKKLETGIKRESSFAVITKAASEPSRLLPYYEHL